MASAWWRTELNYASPALDFGSVFHLVAAEILRTLRAQQEEQIPTEEAMAILREQYAKSNIVLPVDRDFGYEQLVWQVLRFCDHKWPQGGIVSVEHRLFTEVSCPDGKTRILTGQPDALIADPPRGLVVVDFKSGRAKPPEPRDGDLTKDDGKPYLSPQGLFQLHSYGLQCLTEWKGLDYVILREFHTRWNMMREAKLYREELEHVVWEMGDLLQKLDTALLEGTTSSLWRPRPGSHCHFCPGKFDCSIPWNQRGEGSITTEAQALQVATAFSRSDSVRKESGDALKAWIEAGNPPPILEGGHEYVGWREYESGYRSFSTWDVDYLAPAS